MSVTWPGFLVLLAWIPLLAAAYVWEQRRRRKAALRYSSLAPVRAALPPQRRLRRYLPPALYLLALASLTVALARPSTVHKIPVNKKTVILALDVSDSMTSADIQPSRIDAMKMASLSFIRRLEPGAQIGIVTFSTFSKLILLPTDDQDSLTVAIRSLAAGGSTAIGSGIVTSLTGISEIAPQMQMGTLTPEQSPSIPVTGVDYKPEAIILLTDGVNNTGIRPLMAASEAISRRIPIYTIGYGSNLDAKGNDQGPDYSPYWVDTATLKAVSEITGGKYYSAASAGELENVYARLNGRLFFEDRPQEISVVFVALGALLTGAAIALSALWHPLP